MLRNKVTNLFSEINVFFTSGENSISEIQNIFLGLELQYMLGKYVPMYINEAYFDLKDFFWDTRTAKHLWDLNFHYIKKRGKIIVSPLD